jgi:acetylornithine deacetylase/succinyl-diaminopimelate desuccinylase-like protein
MRARLGLVLVLLALPLAAHAQTRTADEQAFLDIYRELVEINTTDSVGDNTKAAEAMAARLRAAGFPAADVQVLAVGAPITVTPLSEPFHSPPSPLDPDLLARVERITIEMWPGAIVIPTMSTGATDSRWLRAAGIPSYGVSGLFLGESRAPTAATSASA